ncbi:hypothetical protein TIFTF001_034663 [Ficus carica]|uniref:Uncharacterized protein n=1 Tax=Ficus carica TaxID=3494 RepID=A0AA88E447_FICCA|nr:hypothetical protein TIFTF001_034663 [Ficus carica]
MPTSTQWQERLADCRVGGLRARPNTDPAKTNTLLYMWVMGRSISDCNPKKLSDGVILTVDEEIRCKGRPSSLATSTGGHDGGGVSPPRIARVQIQRGDFLLELGISRSGDVGDRFTGHGLGSGVAAAWPEMM